MNFAESISTAFDKCQKLLKKAFKQVFLIGFLLSLISQLVMTLIPVNLNPAVIFSVAGLPILLLVALMLVITAIANSVMQLILMSYGIAKPIHTAQAFNITFQRLLRLLIGSVLFTVVATFGFLMYVIPGLIFAALFFLYQPVIIFENIGVLDAFKRSLQLSKQNIFFAMAMIISIYMVLFVPQLAISELATHFPNLMGLERVLDIFTMALAIPFSNSITVTTYSLLRAQLQQGQENVAIG